jgi:hypothetical protein
MRVHATRSILALWAAFVIPACTEETTIIDNLAVSSSGQSFDWSVDAATGDDTNAGTPDAPFKTITHALSKAVLGDFIKVQPGTYDAANGETFPIQVRGGVRLIGDEAGKGDGAAPTLIRGDGFLAGSPETVTVYIAGALASGADAVLAGLKILNTGAAGARTAVLIGTGTTSECEIRNCSFIGSPDVAILIRDGSPPCVVRDNLIRSNGTGLLFRDGGFDARVERNIIRDNTVGVRFFTPSEMGGSWDLGGGPPGSLGANELSSNAQNDLLMSGVGSHNVHASNNFWDHVPPSGNDFFIVSGTFNLTTTGAALAPNPAP